MGLLVDFFEWYRAVAQEQQEPRQLKMYVLVRKELDETYRNVQGSHASLEYIQKYLPSTLISTWNKEPYLIHLGVRFPSGLKEWAIKLSELNIPFFLWKEPDLDDQETALACIDTGEIFKDLRLA